jgi:hypothetical protein
MKCLEDVESRRQRMDLSRQLATGFISILEPSPNLDVVQWLVYLDDLKCYTDWNLGHLADSTMSKVLN